MKLVRLFLSLILGVVLIGCSQQRASDSNTNTANNNTTADANNNANRDNVKAGVGKPDDFMKDAAKGGIMEVQMGQLAMKNGSAEVKKFGQMLVNHHKKANTELMALAKKKNVVVPAEKATNEDMSEELQEIAKLKGAEFDRKWIELAVDAHEKDVDKFKDQAEDGEDAELKAFAAKTLPTLQQHLEQAKSLQQKIEGKTSNNAGDASGTNNSTGNTSGNRPNPR